MRTWRSIEMVYGRTYMQRLRRRMLVVNVAALILGLALGWWLRG